MSSNIRKVSLIPLKLVKQSKHLFGTTVQADLVMGPFYRTQPIMVQTELTKVMGLFDPTQPTVIYYHFLDHYFFS